MAQFTPAQVNAAIKAHGTIFFDADLNPVVPQERQWFCEYEHVIPETDDPAFMRDEALVEFVETAEYRFSDGTPCVRHMVYDEQADECRLARGCVLIRQG